MDGQALFGFKADDGLCSGVPPPLLLLGVQLAISQADLAAVMVGDLDAFFQPDVLYEEALPL